MPSSVFISHSSKDKVTAEAICQRLEADGTKCWIAPRDIAFGSNWTEGIIQGIDDCRVLVLVFSEHANKSEHVRREVAKAFSSGLAVIPFRIAEVTPNRSLAYFLNTVHWLDAIKPPLQPYLETLTERVKQLLTNGAESSTAVPEKKAKPIRPAASKRRLWIAGVGLAVIAVAVWFFISQNRNVRQPAVTPVVAPIPEKSIAVLPFESLSENKSDTYFADGVQDEILNNLAKIGQLKVVSRTSVMQYRADPQRDLRQIANALGVANVLEGTVRRNGNRVRVSTELIDARNDNTVWADSYDRDLTDIFAIQIEVAQAIASKLTATLSPEEKKIIEAKPTDNLEAYDLYLRAKQSIFGVETSPEIGAVEKPLIAAVAFLEKAVRLDPKFTLAYCACAEAHDLLYVWYDTTPERRALADAAVQGALQQQPDVPEAYLASARHLYYGYRDYDLARAQLAIAKRGLPNYVEVRRLQALIDRRRGNFEKAIQEFNEAVTRDPRNSVLLHDLALSLFATRQFTAAAQAFDRSIDLQPGERILKVEKAWFVTFMKTGDDAAFWSAIASLPPSMADDKGVLSLRLRFALVDRDRAQAEQLVEKMKGGDDNSDFAYAPRAVPIECYSILLSRLRGEQPGTNPLFAATREQLNAKVEKSPQDAELLSQLAVVDALINKETAISEAKRATEMLPISKDAVNGPPNVVNLAVVYAWTNELDLAFDTLSPLTKTPYGIYYGQLKREPYWEPLRQDPRYEKLLAELAPRD
jgi:TolB-like protein